MKSIIKIIFSILIITATLKVCSDSKKKETEETVATKKDSTTSDKVTLTTDQYKIAEKQLCIVQMRNLSSVIKVNGIIDVEPQNMVSISSPLGGYVRITAGATGT